MLLATFFVACFGYLSLLAPTAHAAPDATWDGDNILYQGNTYAPAPSDLTPPSDIQAGSTIYQYVDKSKTPNLVYFIYFSPTTDNPKSAKEATYIRYTLNPPNRYINPTGKKTISVDPAEDTATPTTDDGTLSSSCTVDGIGWIVCPLMNGISEGMDFIYERIQGFLSVQPITTSVDNPIYRIWVVSRDLANVAFIIGFLVIIYSYLVGGGFSGYEIRKIMPRLVVAAVLINVSYIICAAAVDVSNITGHGVNQLFENIRDTALPGSSSSADVNWTSVTTWVLAGGAGAGAAAVVLPGVVGGAAGGLWFLLAPFLLGAALLVMVTFLILAARQAIIVIAIAIAPLAFAAFILPNTEKWFEKWRSLFFTMLVMFPAFGAVFGGAQLAGEVIIRTANSIEQIILGLGVMVAPLAITPLLLKLGGGVLNRIGGIVNNANKGAYDRFKNYNRERLADHVARNNERNAQMMRDGSMRRRNVMRRAAYRQNYKKYNRQRLREAHDASSHALYDDNDQGLETFGSSMRRRYANAAGRPYTPSYKYGSAEIADTKHRTELLQGYTHARHDEHWQHELNHDPALRGMLTDTRMAEGRAKVVSGAMEAQDERALQTALNTNPAYANLRNMKVQTSVDAGVAEVQKAAIDAAGKLALSNTVNADRALRQMKVQTYETEKRSETIDNTLKKNAEAHWDYVSKNDDAVQTLRLREIQATDKAKLAQERWNSLVENIAAKGATAPGVAAQNASVANSIMGTRQDVQIEAYVQDSAKRSAQETMSGMLKSDATLRVRAGGVGGQSAANRIYAKAKSDVVSAYLEDVKASRSVLSEHSIEELIAIHQSHVDPRTNAKAPDAMVDAAMQEIVLSKGNNWSFQKTKDYIASRGMYYNEDDRKYYNDYDFDTGVYSNEITDQEEIGRRRDEQQMFVDAVKNSKLKIKSLSGTDRGNLETGTFTLPSEVAIIRDIRDKKITANRLAETDIDELMRTVQVLRDDAMRKRLNTDQRRAMIETIEYATSPDNPEISGNIGTREKEMMQVIAQYLQHDDSPSAPPMTDDEKWAIEEQTQTPIPTHYTVDKFYKRSAAVSGDPNDEPYGPDGRTSKR